ERWLRCFDKGPGGLHHRRARKHRRGNRGKCFHWLCRAPDGYLHQLELDHDREPGGYACRFAGEAFRPLRPAEGTGRKDLIVGTAPGTNRSRHQGTLAGCFRPEFVARNALFAVAPVGSNPWFSFFAPCAGQLLAEGAPVGCRIRPACLELGYPGPDRHDLAWPGALLWPWRLLLGNP